MKSKFGIVMKVGRMTSNKVMRELGVMIAGIKVL